MSSIVLLYSGILIFTLKLFKVQEITVKKALFLFRETIKINGGKTLKKPESVKDFYMLYFWQFQILKNKGLRN